MFCSAARTRCAPLPGGINVLAAVLSLDNLAAGAGLNDAIADGVSSATLALFGLSVGAILFRLLSDAWPCALETDMSQRSAPRGRTEICPASG